MGATRMERRRSVAAVVATLTTLGLTVLAGTAIAGPMQGTEPQGRDGVADLVKAPRCARENAAWIGSFGYGVSCIDEDGWHGMTQETSGLGGDLVSRITIGPDGRAWIVNTGGLSVTNGRTWNTFDRGAWDGGSANAVAFDAQGNPWVAHYEGVSHFDGKEWTTWPSTLLGTGDHTSLVYGVAVAPDGVVWAVTPNSIAAFDGTDWTAYEEDAGLDDRYSFSDIVAGPSGVWAAHSGGVLEWQEGSWLDHSSPDLSSVTSIALDRDGSVWVGTWSHGLSMFDGTGWLTFDRATDGLSSDSVRSVAADAQGRIWAGTDHGLDVYDGDTWETRYMHDSPLLDNQVVAIGVAGDGPVLGAAAPRAPGSLTGIAVEDGTPVADTTVELCTQYVRTPPDSDSTPCADNVLSLQTTTGADGRFTFTDVPVGRYAIAIQSSQLEWLDVTELATEAYHRALVPEGETLDIGTIDLTKAD